MRNCLNKLKIYAKYIVKILVEFGGLLKLIASSACLYYFFWSRITLKNDHYYNDVTEFQRK